MSVTELARRAAPRPARVDHPVPLAVGAAQPVLQHEGLLARVRFEEGLAGAGAVLRVHHVQPAEGQALRLRLPGEQGPAARQEAAAPVRLRHPQHRRRGVGEGAQAGLRLHLGTHVQRDAVEHRGLAVGAVGGAAHGADPLQLPLGSDGAIGVVEGAAGGDGALDRGPHGLPVLRVQPRVEEVYVDARVGRQVEVRLDVVVPDQLPERQGIEPDAQPRGVHHEVEAVLAGGGTSCAEHVHVVGGPL